MIGRLIVGSMVILSFAASQVVSTVHAERSSKEADELLSYLWSAREVDAKCHALTGTQRIALDGSIAELLQLMKVSEAKIRETFKGNNVATHLKCDDDLAKALINMAKASSGTVRESEQDADEEVKISWGDIQESWSNIFRDLPGGTLAVLEGCWNGQVETEPINVCFKESGKTMRVHFGRKSTAICSFEGGGARQRDRSIIFFSPSNPGKCTDGTLIQHIEASCEPIVDSKLDCLVSAFSEGNTIYTTPNGDLVSGKIALTRRKQ